jgi:hypothetical protein
MVIESTPDELAAQFIELVEKNKAVMAELARRNIHLEPLSMLHARIDHLVQAVAALAGQTGPLWATHTRLTWEQHVAEELEKAKTTGTAAVIAQGGSFSPGMIAALAKETRTPGWQKKR